MAIKKKAIKKSSSQMSLSGGLTSNLKKYLGTNLATEVSALLTDNQKLRHQNTVHNYGVDLYELARHGNQWQQNTMAEYIGDFNPDKIPLSTYDRMRWDGQLRLGLMTVKMPIISRDFWIDCSDKDIQAFVYQNLKEIWRPFIKSVLSALDFGFAPHEKIWEIAEDYRVTSKDKKIDYTGNFIKYHSIKDLCQHTITMAYTDKMKFKGLYQNRNNPGKRVFIPAPKSFIFTHDKEWGNLYGWARLKPAYPYWYTYWILDAWHERWLQKRGIPPIIVKYPIGKSQTTTDGTTPTFKDNATIAREAAQSLQPDSVVTIPSDEVKTSAGRSANWDISTLVDNTKIDAFVTAKEKLDVMKLRSILVPERAITQDSSTGSFKMAESHIWIMLESLTGLIGDIGEHTNKYLIPELVKNNFGERAPKATIRIEKIGKELTAALFEIYLGLVQTGKANPGIQKMEEILGIPGETKEERDEREKREETMGIPPQVAKNGVTSFAGFQRQKQVQQQQPPQLNDYGKPGYNRERINILTDRVHTKFLEIELKEQSDYNNRKRLLEEEILKKNLSNAENQGNLLTKLVKS